MRDRDEIDGPELKRLRFVDSGEFEQVRDEFAHPDRLFLDAFHRLGDFFRLLECAHPVQLRIAANRDERSAEFVTRVADEAAHLVDRTRTIREGAVDPVEHGVE